MTALGTLVFGALGAFLASFLGVVSERIHTGQSWRSGRSRCNSCRTVLGARDLLPVLSWIVNRGRCRTCGSRVPIRYALFEAALAIAFALAYLTLGLTLPLAIFLAALLVLGFIVLYDLRHTIVPMTATLTLLLLAGIFSWLSSPELLARHALVSLGISFFFVLLYAGSHGRAMGLGDAPVALALSLLVGSAAIPGLLFSFWIGALVGIGILVARPGGPTMGIEVPFVPFLAVGYLLAYFTQWNPLPF